MSAARRLPLVAILLLVAAVLFMLLFPCLGVKEPYGSLLSELGTTLLCGLSAALLFRSTRGEWREEKRAPRRLVAVASVAAFAVAVNNLPLRALALGNARVIAPAPAVLLFFLLCLCVAVLEECIFRGLLLGELLSRFPKTASGHLAAILVSSAIFGLFHLFNLASGASVPATLLQVGYSFLVGCTAAVLFLLSRRILLPVLFHAVYNFGGLLVPRLGVGSAWDTPTVILTVSVGGVAAVLLVFSFFCGEKT